MKAKTIVFVGTSAVILAFVIGVGVGHWIARPRSVEQSLAAAHECLDRHLMNDGDLSQVKMNALSGYLMQIVGMECDWIGLEICNSKYYAEIEADYLKDYESWHDAFHAEDEKPSEFEGGSMAPLDHNMRLCRLFEQRLQNLKNKWRR